MITISDILIDMSRNALVLNAGVNGIYLSRTSLDAAFDDNGHQVNPLTAQLTGKDVGVIKLLNLCGWQVEQVKDTSLPHQFTLMVRQGMSGKDD